MMVENYERILEKISKLSGVGKEDIIRRIEAKRAKLSGLISPEGAAQIIAAELGVSFDNEKLKLDEIISGMRKVSVTGKVIRLFPVRSFKTQKGDEGKVLNLILADDTSNVKVVLWDTNHISLFEKSVLSEGSVIEILNASVREGEIHLGGFSDIKASTENFDSIITEKVVRDKKISELKISDSARIRAFIVQSFEPRFFEVNKETGRKITDDERAKGVVSEKRALINIILDDGSESIRAVLFHENLKKIGLFGIDDSEQLSIQREGLLGKEFVFSGNVKRNNFFNNEEFVVDSVEEIDVDNLISKFGSK
jgi:ssDNA-binding replication factor A large subunit